MGLPGETEAPRRGAAGDGPELEAFHRGARESIERCYLEHFATVEAAVGGLLGGADRETVIHEVFSRLIADEGFRRSFRGGSLGAWLATVARNQAIDYRRRLARETPLPDVPAGGSIGRWDEAADARLLVERFCRECLPVAWTPVFELCFLRQMSQREAARALGMRRTTLAYRQLRIRRRLRRFLLEGDPS